MSGAISTLVADRASFDASTAAERLLVAASVAEAAGQDFRASKELVGRKQMAAVDHAPSGLQFIVVPGGQFEMGFTPLDVDRVRAAVTDFDRGSILAQIVEFEATCGPVREVVVAPFLLARETASADVLAKVTGGRFTDTAPYPEEALALMEALKDLRLPSEAELEYAGREGGAVTFINEGDVLWKAERRWPDENGWGLNSMMWASWAADEWHPSYDGAPTTSVPWREDGPPGAYRGCLLHSPDNEVELLFGLAAARGRLLPPEDEWDVCVRFARSLTL